MRQKSSPLEIVVIALAAVLAAIVAYHGVARWLARAREERAERQAAIAAPARPEPADLATAATPEPKGASPSFVAVQSIPPMALIQTGRIPTRTKVPPAPKRRER